jgi:hypothetical protein
MWYLIGVVLSFILCVFYIALIHNEKLIEKYEWIEVQHILIKNSPALDYPLMFFIIILWPLVVTIAIMIGFGYCLFKIFSKLIDYFVK